MRLASLVHPRTPSMLLLLLLAGVLWLQPAAGGAAQLPPLPLEDVRAALIAQQAGPTYDAAPAALQTSAVSPQALEDGVATVTFAAGTSPAEAADEIATLGGSIVQTVAALNAYEVALPAGWSVDDGIAALSALPGALRAEPVTRLQLDFHPNDPLYGCCQSYLPLIHAEQAWDVQQGDPRVVVAVVDTGVDITHPDLAPQIWTNPNPGQSGCGNDVHGCNFAQPDQDPACRNANHSVPPNPDVSPGHFHGTFVAGVIAASINNGVGVAGIAPHVSIMPVRVLGCEEADDPAIANGILYAAQNGAQIMNLSLGMSDCQPVTSVLTDAIAQAERMGVLITAAAGNEDRPCVDAPANISGVMAVGSVGPPNGTTRSDYSNWGPEIAVVAPGEGITSTVPQTNQPPPWDYYDKADDGTSFSAPMAAADAALLLSQNRLLTATMLRSLVQRGATPLADNGEPGWAGSGRIDLAQSLKLVPAGFYGRASAGGTLVPDGTPVVASVGTTVCGRATTFTTNGQASYAVFVPPSLDQSGCGTPGATVTITLGGVPAGTGTWSAAAIPLDLSSGAAPAAAPAAPSNLTATVLNDGSVRLSWTRGSTNESGYGIWDGNAGDIATYAPAGSTYTLTGLPRNASFCVIIYAYNAAGDSGWSNWACFSTPP